ncbi:phage baseplate protein [Pectinatus haikarae]|uniref:Dit-like phage tail protein N-terminal domain-containing protein n=1 Tax=Pectinatus haikarae TaxID=349096 RepID=A0ABT9Y3R9_9FIRM|nr:hypothetical protein [Pectinatus haikarae]MDQ0202473.1 hypothetical protein [Pectinatus haikarae]
MGVIGKGLSVDGINYFQDILSGAKKPGWMDFSQQIAKLTGNYTLLNFATGYTNLTNFLFRIPKWPIGGMYFDGIMRTEHLSRIRPTQYPVQTGVVMTDHAVIEPAELTIEIMMTDAATDNFVSTDPILEMIYQELQTMKMYSNILTCKPDSVTTFGNGRAARTWLSLKAMQQSRVPIVVETRLQTYNNMLIEELSAPDDYKTLNALRCTVRLREIIFTEVAETKTSARAAATSNSSTGQAPAQVQGVNTTAAKAIANKIG